MEYKGTVYRPPVEAICGRERLQLEIPCGNALRRKINDENNI